MGRALSPAAVGEIVQRRARLARIEVEEKRVDLRLSSFPLPLTHLANVSNSARHSCEFNQHFLKLSRCFSLEL
ncbi:hypothetical protein DBR34_04165 [Stenotrophomonas sp. HMWF003]|nr:hypothetical protein DBR34_04165 [Stenotrophomonas sp. HMWF003]